MAAPVKVARQQTRPEFSWTFRNIGTFRNPPELASGTYTLTRRNSLEPSGTFRKFPPEPTPALPEPSGTFRNLPEFAPGTYIPAHTGTLRNLLERASRTYTSTHWNSLEPAPGTCTNIRRNSPEPFGIFLRNLLLRPAPTHTGAYLGWRPH